MPLEIAAVYAGVVDGLIAGFRTTFSFPTLLYALAGVVFGLTMGVIPGLGGIVGMSLGLPLAFAMEPTQAMVFLVSISGGSSQGGAITSILLNSPGTTPNAVTTLDGYPLTKQGRGGEAVSTSALSSGIGALFGLLVMVLSIPILEQIVLLFGSVEKFLLVLFGITIIAIVSRGAVLKGLIAGFLGISLALIGLSPTTGTPRYYFGTQLLYNGLHFLPVLLGVFVVSQMISIGASGSAIVEESESEGAYLSLISGIKSLRKNLSLLIRCSAIGTIVGMIPGAGGAVATFVAYGHATQTEPESSKFGTGDIRGIIAPEAANDAKEGGALMPTLALGIPGSGSMIILLGAFVLFGINPGPNVIQNHLDLVFSIIAALIVSNIVSSVIVLVGSDKLTTLARADPGYLVPIIVIAASVGAFAVNRDPINIPIMVIFGVIGFVMREYDYSVISFMLGFVLAPIAETELYKALQFAGRNYEFFITPLSITLFLIIILSFAYSMKDNYELA